MKIKRLPRLLFQIWGMEQLFDVFGLNMWDMQNVMEIYLKDLPT